MNKLIKKLSVCLLLCCFTLLPLTGCQTTPEQEQQEAQPAPSTLADLPETQDMTVSVEGMDETITAQKAMHENFYALYYNPEELTYVPGEVLEDSSFTDSFISVYDDETTEVPTTIKLHYAPDMTPEDWAASVELTEWAPLHSMLDSTIGDTWEATDETATFQETAFQVWNGTNNFVQNTCYTAPFRGGCLAIIVSYPNSTEYIEGWGTRLTAVVNTLVLAAE